VLTVDEPVDETVDEGVEKDRMDTQTSNPDGIETDREKEAEKELADFPPPDPVNIDTPIWESWSESLEGQSPEQVRRVLLYHAQFNSRTYWKDKLTPRNIRSKFREMLDDFPCGWKPPEPEPVPVEGELVVGDFKVEELE
jgi:hypothetical protein